jgi:hypothetical protein
MNLLGPRALPFALLLAAGLPGSVHAQSLHERIDHAVATALPDFVRRASGPSSDAEFLRRVTLDLTGTIPTAAEARAFLADPSAQKRAALIDRLLAGPEHARHLARVLDVWLMERRPDKHVPHADWLEFLRAGVASNKPWDALVREILSSDGAEPRTRPAAKFFLDRDAEPNLVTRDVGRLFLGVNLQCCQCHDHPRIEDYRQEHYYGLFAFLSRTTVVAVKADKVAKLSVLGEKADGEVTFQSVFDKAKVTKSTGPRMPNGPALKEPAAVKGSEYVVAPAAGVRPVPRFSRRALLGPELTRADHEPFRRNLANRLWALMMGRGLVHPLDLDHSANPPTHPELLALLGDDVAARKFDVRGFLGELALSQTYQRSSELPPGAAGPDAAHLTSAVLKPLSPEQLAFALLQATGVADAERKALAGKASEAALDARLAPQAAPLVKAFAAPPGTPQGFDATLDQALFLANSPTVRAWLAPRPGSLTDRLAALPSADAIAEELYLSVLTRPPEVEDRREVAAFLAARPKDRVAALQDLAWALLASAEFRFNH